MTYTTRRPTGAVPWPMLLVAGMDKAGKTYAAAEASGSPLVGRTLWITVGEDQPDEYRDVPGADFEIVEHDGTYRSILGATVWATEQPRVDGKPTLIVFDSGTRLWNLLSEQAQATANERARKKGKPVGPDGVTITTDLWNLATQRWYHVIETLRRHDGPAIITARLDLVSVMDGDRPTGEKHWKVQAQKGLPFDVGAVVHLRSYGDAWLTGVRSLKFRPKPNEYTQLGEFNVHDLWVNLGLEDGGTPRAHAGIVPLGETAERDQLLGQVLELAAKTPAGPKGIAEEWAASHDGEHISAATDLGGLELLRDDLLARIEHEQEAS